jgi:hypothetical protein
LNKESPGIVGAFLYVWWLMQKLLTLALLTAAFVAHAQAPALPATEQRKYDRQHDSMRAVIANQRVAVGAQNDAYIKAHPNYLRQHPELVKAHPEYRTRYAKYLRPAKASAR